MLKGSVIGNLGGNPELKYSASGQPTLRMNVASNYRARTPEGEWQDRTEWVRVTVFGQRVEALATMLKKGMRVYADGRLEARPWTDRAGGVRAGLELIAGDVEFTGAHAPDFDTTDLPVRAGVADERRDARRVPERAEVPDARGTAGLADRGDADLGDLPF
jgi:single-strand DNA-binding protein